MASITLNKLEKHFGTVHAVDGIDLEVKDKEFVVFLGPSGCGKTTTLRCIAGLEESSGGDIRFDDTTVNRMSPADRNIAMVFQFYALYPHMNVRQNVTFPLRAQNMGREQTEEKLSWIAKLLHIEPLLDRRVSELSDGDKQKVALARAIVREPVVLLLDEPLSALDEQYREQMRMEFLRIQKNLNMTTVYVTHDQREAMTLADRIVVMRDGKIVEMGDPESLYENPQNAFTGYFIGSPGMNFMNAEWVGESVLKAGNDEIVLAADLAASARAVTGPKTTLGIRPEYVFFQSDRPKNESYLEVKLTTIEEIRDLRFGNFRFANGIYRCVVDSDDVDAGTEGFAVLQRDKIRFYEPETGKIHQLEQ